MNVNLKLLEDKLCSLMCAEVKVTPKSDDLFRVETPFSFSDGDPYQIYIKVMPGGILKLSDMGHTLMQLSYENDLNVFLNGNRGALFGRILGEHDLTEHDGEIYLETSFEDLGKGIFNLGQAITQITDLTFLNRARVESSFYEDLRAQLFKLVDESKIQPDYFYENMESANVYPIDYRIDGRHFPLFVFGITNRNKAMLTTVILERLLRAKAEFDSLLIFMNQEEIPRNDLARLSNAGGEMVASPDAEDDLRRKLEKRIAA